MIAPKISVIVPTYNTPEGKLKRCLNSLQSQQEILTHYSNKEVFEVVVVDDGSTTTDVKTIVSEYPENFRYVFQENHGVSSARNRGLEEAKGEYIMFADADDYFKEVMLKSSYEIALMFDSDLVIFGIVRYNEHGEKEDYYSNVLPDKPDKYISRVTGQMKRDMCKGLFVPDERKYTYTGSPCAQLFRRSAIGDIRFNEDLKRCEDIVFCLDVLNNVSSSRITIYNKQMYVYVHNAESATHRFYPHMYEVMKPLMKKMDEFVGYNGITRLETDYRFLYSYYSVLEQDLFHKDSKYTNKERKAIFKQIMNDEYFKERIQDVSVMRISKVLKFFGALTLCSKWENYYLTKELFEAYKRKKGEE